MAAFRQGPSGRFDFGRGKGGLVNYTFDVSQMIRKTQRARAEAVRLERAVQRANDNLARVLQAKIAEVLDEKIEERGREQRDKVGGTTLGQAIVSPKNRQVSSNGYTVGYLNENPAVRPYYRGLEVGTDVHVGRFLKGVFRDANGKAQQRIGPRGGRQAILIKGGRDATFLQEAPFRREGPRYMPGVRIKRAIPAYHYFRDGRLRFIQAGGTRDLARTYYERAFAAEGIQLLRLNQSNLPAASGSSTGKLASGQSRDERIAGEL